MAKFLRLKWLRSLLLGVCCLLLITCSPNPTANQNDPLTVGTEPAFPPFEFQAEGGELQGFDIDLMRAIAEAADFEVEFQSLPFDGLIPALQAGTVDAAISSMTITPERLKTVSFSRPYFKAGLAIAVRTQNAADITGLESLKNQTIGVQIGTTGAETAKGIPGASIRTFDSAPLALQALLNGNVDAVINDAPVTLYAIQSNNLQGIRVAGQLVTEEYYGIATAKNSEAVAEINEGLTTLIENGTYARIYRRWFGTEPPPLPEPTAAETATESRAGFLNSLRVIANALPILLQGALITLELTAISVLLGLIGGSLVGLARLSASRPVRWAARAYIDFFRGTPLLVQIFMIYFGLPALLQGLGLSITFNRLVAAVLALTLNSAAYIAEIVRAGIQSIELGQVEASQSLGLGPIQTLRYVIFPQAFRRMLPPLGNEFITLLKDTSLVAVIGFEELFRRGQLIVAANYRAFEVYAVVALVYLSLTLLSSQAFSQLERWMNPVRRSQHK